MVVPFPLRQAGLPRPEASDLSWPISPAGRVARPFAATGQTEQLHGVPLTCAHRHLLGSGPLQPSSFVIR